MHIQFKSKYFIFISISISNMDFSKYFKQESSKNEFNIKKQSNLPEMKSRNKKKRKAPFQNSKVNDEKNLLRKRKKKSNLASFANRIKNSKENLLKGSQFRYINEILYTKSSGEAQKMLKSSPEMFQEYHKGYNDMMKKWPINPLDIIIKQLKKKRHQGKEIIDLGCGSARVAEELKDNCLVRSFDFVSVNQNIIACDIANLPVKSNSSDIAIFSLSLMGVNFVEFICEAHRCLKINGILIISEVTSRIINEEAFLDAVTEIGFKVLKKKYCGSYFSIFTFKKIPNLLKYKMLKKKYSDGHKLLKPCLYKKR